MSNDFVVSARKYRPSTFESVVGQKTITDTLKNALKNNQLAQAFLFCGPRGVGKTTCARILAKVINCQNITENYEPCNECESCVSFNESAAFNIFELDAASNNSVDDIRDLVNQVRIPPQSGKYKVYIIDEVHMLSTAAFNAFLKTLEEPPKYAKFILATTEKHKIIPTILSRCQIFDFKRIGVNDIVKYLEFVAKSEGVETTKEALNYIALKSDGALRDALSMFDQMVNLGNKKISTELVINNLNILDYSYYFKIVDYLWNGKLADVFILFNDVINKGFEGSHFITGFAEHLRNLLMCKDAQTLSLLETGETVVEKYKQQSASIDLMFLYRALAIVSQLDVDYKLANNKRLSIEVAFIKIMQLRQRAGAATNQTTTNQQSSNLNEKKNDKPIAEVSEELDDDDNIVDNEVDAFDEVEEPEQNYIPETSDDLEPTEVEDDYQSEPVADEIVDNKVEEQVAEKKSEISDKSQDFIKPAFSFSLKDVINTATDQDGDKQEDDTDEVDNTPQENETFTETELSAALNEYIEETQKDFLLQSAFFDYQPVINEGAEIVFTVKNDILADKLKTTSNDWMEYIRKKLKNTTISYQVVVKPDENKESIYVSPEKKVEMLIEKNNNIADLIDNLKLTLE
ncbi:MAG: DNA polymerase III subunit gamma/tau [Lentimicrobiaceae bacterium]|nr:DNA polymerase III subunit gamma/tau [Lentimicrobiaceae bacterium]